ncbi:SRPBCC domain-containing protein [Pedobacter sp. GSP4]|uniref:SRPBCC domain-containing protein n=1 Tax=Pedobacter sp. GSP4 TaxID=3453716 RepID=UPI003EE8ADBB
MDNENIIIASVTINQPIELVWELWNDPVHIIKWNAPFDDWINEKIENNLIVGGSFLYVMVKKDGSERFNFKGVYTQITPHESIAYTLHDGRKTLIVFTGSQPVTLSETFEPVAHLNLAMQQEFCQSGLNQLKDYAEQL